MPEPSTSADTRDNYQLPWVLARVDHGLFAFSSRHVREMVSMPVVTAVPNSPSHVRGIINLRGQAMPLVDLRIRLGYKSLSQSTCDLEQLMRQREQDHLRWVNELRSAVNERRAFTLTTDPHGCAFGKWYDKFRTDNLLLTGVLRRFDLPHKRLHDIGRLIVEAMAKSQWSVCETLLHEVESSTLKTMVSIFAETREVLHDTSHEIAMVMACGDPFAIAVDAIETVERLTPATATDDSLAAATDCVDAFATRPGGGLVLTVVPAHLR